MRSIQVVWASLLKLALRPPQQRSSSVSAGVRISGGQLASNQARVSARNVSSVVIAVSIEWGPGMRRCRLQTP